MTTISSGTAEAIGINSLGNISIAAPAVIFQMTVNGGEIVADIVRGTMTGIVLAYWICNDGISGFEAG
jgi:hypothetical protein